MKKHFIVLFLLSSFCVFSQAKLEIKDAKKSFGFVKKGEVIHLDYDITNKGNQPLLITDVEISCSCTTVDYSKQPIAPGQSAKITVNFDTKTVYDRQDRTVNVVSNDPKGPHKLRYKGVVLTK
ncbi:MAG: hypothetical protein K0S32_3275 [Bacteroidetes bacterium]|nr:hypothetical protein [Bacteroidota bacterium]